MININFQANNLQYFLQKTKTAPDYCSVKNNVISLYITCNSAIAKRAIPPLSASNFINCLFYQNYPKALKNLNIIKKAFIAHAYVIGIFLKLTSDAKGKINYKRSRDYFITVR